MNQAAIKLETKRFPENLPPDWQELLAQEKDEAYFQKLAGFLKQEARKGKRIFPERSQMLRALQLTDFKQVKVVILGQDPYHGPGQAVGLSFAVPNTCFPKPPSLGNIFKELESDLDIKWDRKNSELTGWARQGVLLLNAVLSVEAAKAFSHRNQGWEIFTDKIIHLLNQSENPIAFVLWGAAAQKKASFIDKNRHCIIASAHPSPLSAHRGFFGSKVFSRVNSFLTAKGRKPIDWTRINE